MTDTYKDETEKVRQGEKRNMTPILIISTIGAIVLLAALALIAPF